ncbi:MAG: hypothetical protein ISR28_05495 [SAR86 cluster bacterium]|nr:hypothetical protein [SAR86 cluster bacterium]
MKRILILLAILSMTISATENFLGVKYNSVSEKNEVYSIDPSTGKSTLLVDFAFPSGYWQPSASFLDSYNGNLYMKDSNGDLVQFNPLDNSVTFIDVVDTDFQSVFQTPWIGKDLIFKNAASETQVGDADNGITISNSSEDTEIKDSEGKTIIKTTAEGETHIGENSLVTVETDGVQLLYATNASEEQININIKKGTDLLIDGVSVAGSLSTNATNIATNTTSIATNTTDIATNKTSIATNTTDIATNKTSIATNTTDIATNKTSIATNTTNIAANTAEIATYTDSIASNTTAVAALGSDLSTFKASANSQMNYMKSDYSSGIASAVAMSQFNLAQDGFSIGVGRGSYNDENETAFGLGYGGEFKNGTLFKLQASKSGDASGVGLTISF